MSPHEWINLLIGLLLPLAVGYGFICLARRSLPFGFLPLLAISYGLGMGFLSQIMLLAGILNIPYSAQVIRFCLILIAGIQILFYLIGRTAKSGRSSSQREYTVQPAPPTSRSVMTPTQKFLYGLGLFYILYYIIFVFWYTLNVPVHSWDAVATVAFKAKIFFFDRTLHRLNLPHPSYPLHVSLVQSWIALNIGRWDEYIVNIIFPLTFLSYLVLHYYFLKSRTDSLWALAGTCLLLSSNFFVYHAAIPYADFSLMYYNCTAIILLLTWDKQKNAVLLLLASVFAGMTAFVKLEGTIYLVLHTSLLILILKDKLELSLKKKWHYMILFILPGYGISGLFHVYKRMVGITGMEGRLKLAFIGEHFQRLPAVIDNFGLNLFASGNWNMLWVLLMAGLVLHFQRIKYQRDFKLLGWMMAMSFLVYVVFFVLTGTDINYHNTISRVMLHFLPLLTWLIVLLYYPRKETFRQSQPSAAPGA